MKHMVARRLDNFVTAVVVNQANAAARLNLATPVLLLKVALEARVSCLIKCFHYFCHGHLLLGRLQLGALGGAHGPALATCPGTDAADVVAQLVKLLLCSSVQVHRTSQSNERDDNEHHEDHT